jgi:hypothetical protein
MTISRAQITKQLIPGLHEIIGLNYKSIDNEHTALFDTFKSNRSFEEEVLMSGLGEAPIKSEGTGVAFDDAQESWSQRYIHNTIALAFSVTEEAMEDNLYDTFSRIRAEALGRSMASTKQQLAADVVNNGFNASVAPMGDGVALFSASHPLVGGGVMSNTTTADFSETALENATIAISLFVDDRNILINALPKSLHLPPQLQFAAFKVLKSDKSTTLATNSTTGVTNVNDVNAINQGGYFPGGMHINHRFTDPDGWMIKTDVPNGFKYFERAKLAVSDDGDFTTGNLRIKARERYSFNVTDFRAGYGSDGSA